MLSTDNYIAAIGGGVGTAGFVISLLLVALLCMRRKLQREHENDNGNPQVDINEHIYANKEEGSSNETGRGEYVNIEFAADSNDIKISLFSKKKLPMKKSEQNDNILSKAVPENVDQIVYNNVTSEQNKVEHKIAVSELQDVINKKHMNKGFEKEYEMLPKGLVRPHVAASMEENTLKNRFLTTLPYDHSRVILSGKTGDYINASYIDSYDREKAYIATQGPKKKTINDFWQMIWQENVEIIVMLAQLVEEGRKKCEQYWPESSTQPLVVGNYRVSLIKENERTVYICRTLNLFDKVRKLERTVMHYHFTQWPDHDVPDQIKLVNFYRKVHNARTSMNSPIVVHCSAGVGRTGTFIAIDALYENGQRTGYVDVTEYVQIMRKDRMNMIQTTEQYATVFAALLELFTVPHSAISTDSFYKLLVDSDKDLVTKNQGMEFQKLKDLKPTYSEKDFSTSKSKTNIAKNADLNILPHDSYRPFLMSFERNRSDYINAIIIPSYLGTWDFLVTQYPLHETVVDFWTMVYDNNCSTVVVLEPFKDDVPLCPKKNEKFEYKILRLTTTTENCLFPIDINLRNKAMNDTKVVSVFSMDEWSEENVPYSTKCMLDLFESVMSQQEKRPSSITVVCRDGCTRSGVFVALALILEKMKLDDEVDIFQVVRTLQIRRPEFFATFEQYQYCYRFVQEKLEGFSVYANA